MYELPNVLPNEMHDIQTFIIRNFIRVTRLRLVKKIRSNYEHFEVGKLKNKK